MSDALKHIGVKTETPHGTRVSDPHAAAATNPAPDVALDEDAGLEQRAVAALRKVYDPEIPVNIYDLGLIYSLDVDEQEGVIVLEMTLTAPGCPVAQTFPGEIEARLRELDGVEEVTVRLVWDPPWTQDRMSEGAKLQLGLL
jgi:FeS assembly SUF system protein